MNITFFENIFRDDFIWTGLRRDSTGNEKWTDNAAPAWTNYATGNPTTASGSFCFALNPPNGDWLEHSCSQKHMFVCEMDVGMSNCGRHK